MLGPLSDEAYPLHEHIYRQEFKLLSRGEKVHSALHLKPLTFLRFVDCTTHFKCVEISDN